ncbi:MAG: exonuclease SbcCD subunit D [Treponema sp.]|nr:exonuclease SbcCD subunit D [Treponema sp.]
MKFIHTADLHLGKTVNGFSMLEDQRHILSAIVDAVGREKPDALVIAGDIYDKAVPPEDAVQLFEDFLEDVSGMGVSVLAVSGNHDSAVRFSFGSELMKKSGIHFAHPFCPDTKPVSFSDEFGEVLFYMLPFVRPSSVRRFFPEEEIGTYEKAVECCVRSMRMDPAKRNVLVAHQFVTGAQRSDSEEVSVGGLDNVAAEIFDGIDYVALGHIHGPQKIGRESLRYSGTPLKYSFSECSHKKSLTLVTMAQKGCVTVDEIPLVPLHDMRMLRGTFSEVCGMAEKKAVDANDYVGVILTDEEEVPSGSEKLRNLFPNLMSVEYDNTRTRLSAHIENLDDVKGMSPLDLFDKLYEQQNARHISDMQKKYLAEMIDRLRGGE